ncbi:MAG: hypothetical protein EOP06_06985 [Proteobacteria bacterium]|nr:MAG: hypothetical protein EOP06_06985 [Pseudomonadota bacterium]
MIKSVVSLLLSGFLVIPVSGFVASLTLSEKAAEADVIARGVVVKIIQLTAQVTDSGGSNTGKNTDEGFSGPHAIAVVRVTDTLKGQLKSQQGIIFVPCGYSFDESPAELTATKEYVLFLQDMGRSYYHPTTAFSTHRVQAGRVGKSGFDYDGDFKAEKIQGDTQAIEEFVKQIKEALAAEKSE